MTEYDYSPEAYDRYMRTQNRISNWVSNTKAHERQFANPFVPSAVNGGAAASSPSHQESQRSKSNGSNSAGTVRLRDINANVRSLGNGMSPAPPLGQQPQRSQSNRSHSMDIVGPSRGGYVGSQRSKALEPRESRPSESPSRPSQSRSSFNAHDSGSRPRSQSHYSHSQSQYSHSQSHHSQSPSYKPSSHHSYAPRSVMPMPPPAPPAYTPYPYGPGSGVTHKTYHRDGSVIHLPPPRPGESYVILL